MIEYQINEHRDNQRVCHGSATPTDRGRTRPFSNGDAASYDERASTRSNTATRRLAPRRRAHQLSFPTPTNLPSSALLLRFLSYHSSFIFSARDRLPSLSSLPAGGVFFSLFFLYRIVFLLSGFYVVLDIIYLYYNFTLSF